MKKLVLLTILVVSCGMISHADALTLSIGDDYYVGSINDGIPSSEALEASYINYLITLPAGQSDTTIGTEVYNRVSSTIVTLETVTDAGAVKVDVPEGEDPPFTWNTNGFEYVLGKYDANKAGSLVWYLDGGFGEVTLPSTFNGLGLSHYTGFVGNGGTPGPGPGPDPVPEPATMLLFGTGLVGLAGLRMRKKQK